MLKKTNIDVKALLDFIMSGGNGQVDVELLEQIASLVTPTKKEPNKYDAEVVQWSRGLFICIERRIVELSR